MSHISYTFYMRIIKNDNTKREFIRSSKVNSIFNMDITDITELLLFEKDDYLIKEGEIQNYLLFMVQGEVRITMMSTKGSIFSLGATKNFEIFGEASALWNEIPENSIISTKDTYCLGISLYKYRNLLLTDTSFLIYMAKLLSKRLKKLRKNTITFMESNADSLLASYILQNSVNGLFTKKLTVAAEAIGISYRHLIRTLNSLCEQKMLKKENRRYYITDYVKMSKLSEKAYRYYS